MLFESPQRRNSHNTLVPTKLSGRSKVRMSDAGTFPAHRIQLLCGDSSHLRSEGGMQDAASLLGQHKGGHAWKISLGQHSSSLARDNSCLVFVCDAVSRFFYSSQMCWAPPNYFTDEEISNNVSVA